MNIQRLKTFFFFALAKLPMKRSIRCRLIKWGGVDCADNHSLIGNVVFDSIHPENIHLGRGVCITDGVVILTHYLNTNGGKMWRFGHVYSGNKVFIGMNTIICKDIKIGKNCIIAAGSVVTKDIPDNEIWGGNPARFIKKRVPWEWQNPKDFE